MDAHSLDQSPERAAIDRLDYLDYLIEPWGLLNAAKELAESAVVVIGTPFPAEGRYSYICEYLDKAWYVLNTMEHVVWVASKKFDPQSFLEHVNPSLSNYLKTFEFVVFEVCLDHSYSELRDAAELALGGVSRVLRAVLQAQHDLLQRHIATNPDR